LAHYRCQLAPEEEQRGLAALQRITALSDEIMVERDRKRFSRSGEILNALR
jgi:hypothetical protein